MILLKLMLQNERPTGEELDEKDEAVAQLLHEGTN